MIIKTLWLNLYVHIKYQFIYIVSIKQNIQLIFVCNFKLLI